MSWALGWDDRWGRWIGYGVPAHCDHPQCSDVIDRGLSYVCGGEPYGGEDGCGLYFCAEHRDVDDQCERCEAGAKPFEPKREHPEWVRHVTTDPSWQEWRATHPERLAQLTAPARREEER